MSLASVSITGVIDVMLRYSTRILTIREAESAGLDEGNVLFNFAEFLFKDGLDFKVRKNRCILDEGDSL